MQVLATEQLVKEIGKDVAVRVLQWLEYKLWDQKNALVMSKDIAIDQGKAQAIKKLADDIHAVVNAKS